MPTVLTRRELYDLVWSKPMRDLAAEFGISDVGLAKICDRHRVPKPGRGYWAKLQAGKKIAKAIFREVDDRVLNRVEIHSGTQQLPPAAREVIERAKVERSKQKSGPPPRVAIGPTEPVQDVHQAIRRTAQVLRKAKQDANGAVHAVGDGLCGIDIAAAGVERVIALLDSLARKLEAKALKLEPTGQGMRVAVGPDSATFTIKERTRQEKHVATPEELAAEERRQKKLERYWRSPHWNDDRTSLFQRAYPESDTVYTGDLVFQIDGYADGVRRKWADGKTQTVESLLDSIVVGLEALLAVRKADRDKREEWQRQWHERERRRELERQRAEREKKRITYLNSIFDIHDEIRRLRDWLDHIETQPDPEQAGAFGRMVVWAKQRLVFRC